MYIVTVIIITTITIIIIIITIIILYYHSFLKFSCFKCEKMAHSMAGKNTATMFPAHCIRRLKGTEQRDQEPTPLQSYSYDVMCPLVLAGSKQDDFLYYYYHSSYTIGSVATVCKTGDFLVYQH